MDPWGFSGSESSVLTSNPSTQFPHLKFEDNFTPAVRDRLPDSEQYLALLEKRLRDIKNDPDVLKQLIEKREACMQNLLNSDAQFAQDDDLETPVTNSVLIRTLQPQNQALNKGEVVDLLNYDQFNSSESEPEQ